MTKLLFRLHGCAFFSVPLLFTYKNSLWHDNDVARTLKKLRSAHQRETTESSDDSLQLCSFSKMGTSLKGKNLLPEGANSFLYE